MKNKPILIIAGEPKSTFIEIFLKFCNSKSFKKLNLTFVLIVSKKLLYYNLKLFNKKIPINFIDKKFKNLDKKKLNVIDIPLNKISFNPKNNIIFNKYLFESFDVGLRLMKKNKCSALINGPIFKKSFLKGKYKGITEYLAKKTKSKGEVMLIYNSKLSVSPLTTHLPINKVTQSIKKEQIVSKILKINSFYVNKLKFKPKIAITGLNPHCESFDNNSDKEKTEIIPAIRKLKKFKINIKGPMSADTIFLKSNLIKFDIIFGMYHDQVLGPMKTIFGFNAINITLGLPFIRITPDHGPNSEMFGKNRSNPNSFFEAMKFIKKHV